MLRQALVVPSRALRSASRSIAQKPLSRPQTFISPITVRRIQPTAARWYSEAAKESQEAGKDDAKDAGKDAEVAGSAEEPAVAELKKKLEAKEKEASDWKVRGATGGKGDFMCFLFFVFCFFLFFQWGGHADSITRTNAFAPSPTSATSRTAPSARSRTPASSPSRASPRTSSRVWTTWTARSPWCPRTS